MLLRCTSAPPTPSIGIVSASSWTITITAKMPKAAGGISRARTTIEPNRATSIAIRE